MPDEIKKLTEVPRKANVDYFFHPSDCMRSVRMRILRRKFGAAGYGIYWYFIETFARESGLFVELNQDFYETMEIEFEEKPKLIKEIADFCISKELFVVYRDTGKHHSPPLDKGSSAILKKRGYDHTELRRVILESYSNE